MEGNAMKNKKCLLFSLFLLTSLALLSAQAGGLEGTYRKVDAAIAEKSLSNIEIVLKQTSSASWYPRVESYTLKKARELVILNELDLVKGITLIIIDINLDNKDAVGLYQSVQGAIAIRDDELKKAAEQKAFNAYKQKAAETKVKQDIARPYKTTTNATAGKKIYLEQDFNTDIPLISWDLMIGFAHADLITEMPSQNIKYGLGGSGSFFYNGDYLTIGADVSGGYDFVTIFGDQSAAWFGEGVVSASATKLSRNFALRGGYATFSYDTGSTTKVASMLMTPVLGLGFRDIPVGKKGRFHISADYLAGHLLSSSIPVGIGANLGFASVLADFESVDILFHFDIKDNVFLYSRGPKNDAKLILAIGVGNYE